MTLFLFNFILEELIILTVVVVVYAVQYYRYYINSSFMYGLLSDY